MTSMFRFALLAGLCALGSTRPAMAQISFTGYLKSWAVVQESISNDFFQTDEVYQSQNAGRFMLESLGDLVNFQLHYEVNPVLVSRTLPADIRTLDAVGNVVGDSYRMTDLHTTLKSDADDKQQVYQNLDRLNMQFRFDGGDLTLGRQAISLGAARFINPTDIFLPFDVRTLNTEYRTGVDAVRFQRPWGELGEIDVGLVLGTDAKRETSAAFLQLRENVNGNDLSLAFVEFARQRLVGAGVQSELWNLGFWLEVAYVDAGRVDAGQHYFRASMGADYAFTENIVAMLEYHYNGAGSRNPQDYLAARGKPAYRRGGVFLLGQNYLLASLGMQATPLWNFGLQTIMNLDDDSAFGSLSVEYNIAEDMYMDFGIYAFAGDDLRVSMTGAPGSSTQTPIQTPVQTPMQMPVRTPVLQSEYGASPTLVFASIRWYF